MEDKLCMNCFAEYHPQEGYICPVCGWDNEKPQFTGGLRYNTLLASRYAVGRAKAVNGEGITYSALDVQARQLVELREFFPASICGRAADGKTVVPVEDYDADFAHELDEFIQLSRGVSRLRELSVVSSVVEIFEDNNTAYTVYKYTPAVSLRRYVESSGGNLDWNTVNRLFMPVLTALGILNSLGMPHLGISPNTLRVTKNGVMYISGFSVADVRRDDTLLPPELFSGCAAPEQYLSGAACGETSDVYALAACMLFALTGSLPQRADLRANDQRLLISRDLLKKLPPFVVTAIANALQLKPSQRTSSFERFKTELSSTPTVINEIEQTEAIRSLPSGGKRGPRKKGLPSFVWLLLSLVITLSVLSVVASMWLGDRGMSFTDLSRLVDNSSTVEDGVVVPNMVNESYEEWAEKIRSGDYDFKIKVSERVFSDTIPEGNITSQTPTWGETVSSGETVLVTVSKGTQTRTLPSIEGTTYAELQRVLIRSGFTPEIIEEPSDNVEAGYVIRYQDYEAGQSLEYGSAVVVVVSSGPSTSAESSAAE